MLIPLIIHSSSFSQENHVSNLYKIKNSKHSIGVPIEYKLSKLWEYQMTGIPGDSIIGKDGTIYLSHQFGLYAIEPNGVKKWEFRTGDDLYGKPAINLDGTVVYIFSNFCVWAVNNDGTLRWKFNPGDEFDLYKRCIKMGSHFDIGKDGTIYVGGFRPICFTINPDGTKKWSFRQSPDSFNFFYQPSVANDGTTYICSDDQKIYAINSDGTKKWYFSSPIELPYPKVPIGKDNTIYIKGHHSNVLKAISSEGVLKWKATTGNSSSEYPIIDNETIYIGSYSGLHAIDANNGVEKWKSSEEIYLSNSFPFIVNKNIYVTSGSSAYIINKENGSIKKKIEIEADSLSNPVIKDGKIYISSKETGKLYAIDTDNSISWEFETKGREVNYSPSIDKNNIFIQAKGKLISLDKNGTKRWDIRGNADYSPVITSESFYAGSLLSRYKSINGRFESSSQVWNGNNLDTLGPALNSNGKTVYAILGDFLIHSAYELRAMTHIENKQIMNTDWVFPLKFQSITSNPAIGSDGTIYLCGKDPIHSQTNINALNPDGCVKWRFPVSSIIQSSPIIGNHGTIYVGDASAVFYAIDSESGMLKWKIDWLEQHPYFGNFMHAAIDIDETLYLVNQFDSVLYAIDSSGNKKWEVNTEGQLRASPAVGDNGTVFFFSYSDTLNESILHAVDTSGNKKWEYKVDSKVYLSPIIDEDGVIYFCSHDGRVFALKSDCSGPAKSSWPMENRDSKHTRNVGYSPPSEIKDTDADGVIDIWDKCPITPKNSCVNNKGCSCDNSFINEKGAVEKNKWKTYYKTVDNTYSKLIVKIENLTNDVDLYVRKGSKADFDNYDCRPYKGSKKDEVCELSNNGNNLWYFCVYGYKEGEFNISVEAKSAISENESTNNNMIDSNKLDIRYSSSTDIKNSDKDGVIDIWDKCPDTPENSCVNNQGCPCDSSLIDERGSVEKSKWKTYYANIDEAYSNFTAKLENLSDDVDLYVRKGSKPDFKNYDCRPYKGSKRDEVCELSNNGNNLWYFSVYGYKAGEFNISVKAKR